MPYWSSSRVGAVPQGQPSKPKSRKDRYHHCKKGITMEDLKKQTAIRLAQEQHQGRPANNNNFSAPEQRGVVPRSYSSPAAPSPRVDLGYHAQPQLAIPPEPSPPPPYQQQQQQQLVNSGVHSLGHYSVPPQGSGLSSLPVEEHVVSTPVKRGMQLSHSYHIPEQQHQRSAPRPSRSCASDSSAKSKLPHGLTVHELKEMTKARLQAEASEKQNPDVVLGPIPSVVRASMDLREHFAQSPTAPSPVPHNTFGRNARSPYTADSCYAAQSYHENWSTTDSRNDPWENGSVSTQTSDYIGSEHAFGVASFNGDDNVFHNRARSLSASSGFAHNDYRDAAASPAMGQQPCHLYLDNSSPYPQNRRRAATLSPRAGLSSSSSHYLHEHRPVFPGQELVPGLPSLSGNRPNYMAPRSRGAFFSPTQQEEANRARTLSAVSLPAMSRTAEEFAMNDATTSSLLVTTTTNTVTGLSDVFRESPVGHSLDFLYEPRSRAWTTEETASPNNLRSRAWTTEEPSPTNLFGGTSNLFPTGPEDFLANDLASILKLSGADKNDHNGLM